MISRFMKGELRKYCEDYYQKLTQVFKEVVKAEKLKILEEEDENIRYGAELSL